MEREIFFIKIYEKFYQPIYLSVKNYILSYSFKKPNLFFRDTYNKFSLLHLSLLPW